jgi:hypothetical protein
MRRFFGLASSLVLALGTSGIAIGQETAPPSQGPRQALQRVHGPRSIDQELDHLTRNLELTSDQQQQVRPLLQQHHDRIQVLFDSSPTLPRQALAPSASPVQVFWFCSGPRPSRESQCGWLSPVINSRGLLPMRPANWLRM